MAANSLTSLWCSTHAVDERRYLEQPGRSGVRGGRWAQTCRVPTDVFSTASLSYRWR